MIGVDSWQIKSKNPVLEVNDAISEWIRVNPCNKIISHAHCEVLILGNCLADIISDKYILISIIYDDGKELLD